MSVNKDKYNILIQKTLAPLIRFWIWWRGELKDIWHEFFADRKRGEDDILRFRLDGEMLYISSRIGQEWQQEQQLSLTDKKHLPEGIRAYLSSVTFKGRRRIMVRLPREHCLVKPLTLPRAALTDLREILVNQIDRLIPYSADQIYFDYQINPEYNTPEKIRLDIFIIPKIRCDDLLGILRDCGLTVNSLEVSGVSARPCEEIVLHGSQAAHEHDMGWYKRIAVVVGAILGLAALPIAYNHYQISSLENNIGDSKFQARSSALLKRDFERLRQDVNFLVDKKRNNPLVIQVVNEVSARLGDDTWLEQLTIRKNTLQIFGYSATASGVLEDLEKSPLFNNAHFLSAVVQQKQKDVERFQVAADVNRPRPKPIVAEKQGEGDAK